MEAAKSSTRTLERVLASLGVVLCVVVCFWAGLQLSAIPLLTSAYLIEAVVVSVTCGASIWLSGGSGNSFSVMASWTTIGILIGFTIMGLWSIGVLFMPADALFIVAAVLAGCRRNTPMIWIAGVCILATVAQAALMLSVVRFVSSYRAY